MLSVGAYWAPARYSAPLPAMLRVLFALSLQEPGSSSATTQFGSFSTSKVMGISLGLKPALVCTGWLSKPTAAVASWPLALLNFVPPFSAMTGELLPSKTQPELHSLKTRATPGLPAS